MKDTSGFFVLLFAGVQVSAYIVGNVATNEVMKLPQQVGFIYSKKEILTTGGRFARWDLTNGLVFIFMKKIKLILSYSFDNFKI